MELSFNKKCKKSYDKRGAISALNLFEKSMGRHGRTEYLRMYSCSKCCGWHLTKQEKYEEDMALLGGLKCDCDKDLKRCDGSCFVPTKRNNNYDPFLDDDNFYKQLEDNYKKHGNLVVAVDFDSTLYPFRNEHHRFPKLIKLIQDCKKRGFLIIIFTSSPKERYGLIQDYCAKMDIPYDAINQDLVFFRQYPDEDWSNSKIFYNILLDDKAGLSAAYKVLRKFVDSL